VVLAYNLESIKSLNLTIEHITGIYNGTYTYWNDSSIASINPQIVLPDAKIRVRQRKLMEDYVVMLVYCYSPDSMLQARKNVCVP